MLAAILRVPPAPIPIAPTRPLLLRRRGLCLQPEAPMASAAASSRDAGATKPNPAPVPQPPEKPLPGDCCGSGCVRCVWDVYYDELDAYNKALAAHSSSSTESCGKVSSDSKTSDDSKS